MICRLSILVISFFSLFPSIVSALTLVSSGQQQAIIWISQNAGSGEEWAAREIQNYIYQISEAQLPIERFSRSNSQLKYISICPIGSHLSNPELTQDDLAFFSDPRTDQEGYIVRSQSETISIIASNDTGLIYGSYALIESILTKLTGLISTDLDFLMPKATIIELDLIDLQQTPFYPIRATLEIMEPDWLVRHRLNMSGGEGVWSGTGNDDGLGTAFKYVRGFDTYQDDPPLRREERIQSLGNRFQLLKARGVEPYLFMYVTGEATQALINQRPDLFEPPVFYGGSRDGISYRPFCWTNPDFLQLAGQLVQEIVRTYPDLAGFHLRAWGYETRACNCPKCGDRSAVGQQNLWNLFFTIIEAARNIRPNFKFYLSGYNQSWLRDPDGAYASQLPLSTIFSKKWGYDGEPVADPKVPLALLDRLGKSGHHLIVLSHDVEEVMPLWMIEGDLFVEGVRKFGTDQPKKGLGGFTVQGASVGLGPIDQILSAKINFDPNTDHFQLLKDYLANGYGPQISPKIMSAIRINTWVMSSYFSDYAGSSSITGDYGKGSAMFATRFWDIIGTSAVQDILSIPSLEQAIHARDRLVSLTEQQKQATDYIKMSVIDIPNTTSQKRRQALLDTMEIFEMWLNFFSCRQNLAQAIVMGYTPAIEPKIIQSHIQMANEYNNAMQINISQIRDYVPVFGYSRPTIVSSLTEKLKEEATWLEQFPVQTIIRELKEKPEEKTDLVITEPHNHPNPFRQRTTFVYELSRYADQVKILIYSASGRLLQRLDGFAGRRGYNETAWNGRDQQGRILPNGVYFYTISAEDNSIAKPEKHRHKVYGKLAILR